MEEYLPHIIAIIALPLLCGFWVCVQLLAKKIGTKNHIDYYDEEHKHGIIANCQTDCSSCQSSCSSNQKNECNKKGTD
jgi:hypothetical protein